MRARSWAKGAHVVGFVLGCVAAGAAPAQTLLLPSAVTYDAAGNLYIADAARHQIFEATLGGQLVLIAGSGVQGFAGDNGPAVTAQLSEPQGLVAAADGTLYVADTGNQRIRAITAGVITTIAGTGSAGFSGDGGPAIAATLRSPRGLALDGAGGLLIADAGNRRVRRLASGTLQTIAGNGVQGFAGDGGPATGAQLDTPDGVAVLGDGRIAIADAHNQRVRVVALDGTISTLAGTGVAGFGDGAAATARFSLPRGIAAGPSGSLIVADTNNQRIRLVAGGAVTTLAGGAQGSARDGTPAASAPLNAPRAVALSSFNESTVADSASHTVLVLAENGELFEPAALVAGRASAATPGAPVSTVYGAAQTPVTVTGSVATPLGQVQLLEGGAVIAAGSLANGVTTLATPTLAAGTHALIARYLGDGLNPASGSVSFAMTIVPAASTVIESAPAAVVAGSAVSIAATVVAATSGTPTGSVTFLDGGSPVATGSLSNGVAQATLAAPAVGSHSLVASYGGDGNFFASLSPAIVVVVGGAPDFTIASTGSSSQSIAAGSSAAYGFTITSVGGAFSGAVSLGVAGLPAGATASFAPPQVIPGTASAVSTLTVQTAAGVVLNRTQRGWLAGGVPILCLFAMRRRRRGFAPLLVCLLAGTLGALVGCGDRTAAETTAGGSPQTFNLTITGTGTGATGSVLVHSAMVTLTVR